MARKTYVLERIDANGDIIDVIDASPSFRKLLEEVFQHDEVAIWRDEHTFVQLSKLFYFRGDSKMHHVDGRFRFRCVTNDVVTYCAIETFGGI